jgi:excisionase family DNA binding protein
MIEGDGVEPAQTDTPWDAARDEYARAVFLKAVRPQPKGYLRAAEAAAMLHVSPKTISRWAREGRINHVVTLGGHRRFVREEIEGLADRLVVGNGFSKLP